MIDWLKQHDQEVFLWLNGLHASWLDAPMALITGRGLWIPFYVLLVLWLIYKQRQQAVWSILFIAAAVALSDQLTSSLMKPFFERLRPCHDPVISHLVHTVAGCGGKYGFASSHAANTFALATAVTFLHPGKTWLQVLITCWALLVSYSRIYVGVHYPGDLIAGALIGVVLATSLYLAGRKAGKLKQV